MIARWCFFELHLHYALRFLLRLTPTLDSFFSFYFPINSGCVVSVLWAWMKKVAPFHHFCGRLLFIAILPTCCPVRNACFWCLLCLIFNYSFGRFWLPLRESISSLAAGFLWNWFWTWHGCLRLGLLRITFWYCLLDPGAWFARIFYSLIRRLSIFFNR